LHNVPARTTATTPGSAPDEPPAAAPPQRFQILALDGGGYRGLYSAAVLGAIEQDLGRPILDYFDLVAGTSTGGLIALGLGAGLRPRDIIDFYATWGPQIFRRQHLGILRPRYGSGKLREGLAQILGEKLLGDSRCRLVVPAYDLTADQVYVFKTPHHERLTRDWKETMVDVAMATSAAPTYFPAHSLRGIRLVDGGVWCNNPSVIAIAEATSMLGVPITSVRLFSVGTTAELVHRHPRLDQGGMIQWAKAAIDVLMRGQSVGADGLAQHLLTRERYLRHDTSVPVGVLRMDRCDTDELIGLAESRSRDLMPVFNAKFASHRASAYQPLHTGTGASA
jgi:patatin-like phospholipase/acyl hydrolase